MAIRQIIKDGDPTLRKVSREVTDFDDRLHQLLDDMYDTMQAANGVGLAAVQVGILRRVVVIDIGAGKYELINPVIVESSEETECASEGCLSYPGEYLPVPRPIKVRIEAKNRDGEAVSYTGEGLLARAFCHETDHLDGIVFRDLAIEEPELEEYY